MYQHERQEQLLVKNPLAQFSDIAVDAPNQFGQIDIVLQMMASQ